MKRKEEINHKEKRKRSKERKGNGEREDVGAVVARGTLTRREANIVTRDS